MIDTKKNVPQWGFSELISSHVEKEEIPEKIRFFPSQKSLGVHGGYEHDRGYTGSRRLDTAALNRGKES